MADDIQIFGIKDERSARTLRAVCRYVLGMMRANVPGGSNGADGPVFPDVRPRRTPLSVPPPELPTGQYVGMVYQVVAQNKTGFDWVPAVDAP